ncbi:MAG: Smr/MutS family protein [Acidithiobacillus sp.]|uniref:Smr/MutS family protein n=1 Tax=Acidithiobacillus sp. TaxID=1872118 RepID=UPI0025C46581|nr:Smr/MutS family protein [Acidithiobacillus sp.]
MSGRRRPKARSADTVVPGEGPTPDECALFRESLGKVRPFSAPEPPPRPAPPPPEARQREADELAVIAALDKPSPEDMAWLNGDEWVFLRPGLPQGLLRDLRRGRIRTQSDLDLHGLIAEEARLAVAQFLQDARRQRLTCVRIIHGKGLGSPGQMPVLKRLVGLWLMRRQEVLAFTQAHPAEGGSGALRVLLGRGTRKR